MKPVHGRQAIRSTGLTSNLDTDYFLFFYLLLILPLSYQFCLKLLLTSQLQVNMQHVKL